MSFDLLIEYLNKASHAISEFMKDHIPDARVPTEEWERQVLAEIQRCAQTFEDAKEREDFIRKQESIWYTVTCSDNYKKNKDAGNNLYAKLCARRMFDSLATHYSRTPELAHKYIIYMMKKKID